MDERRQFPRVKIFKSAKVILANRSPVSCVVRDLSNHGAGLQFTSTADLPAEFDLSFDTGLMLRKCRIAWQTRTYVGVADAYLKRQKIRAPKLFGFIAQSCG